MARVDPKLASARRQLTSEEKALQKLIDQIDSIRRQIPITERSAADWQRDADVGCGGTRGNNKKKCEKDKANKAAEAQQRRNEAAQHKISLQQKEEEKEKREESIAKLKDDIKDLEESAMAVSQSLADNYGETEASVQIKAQGHANAAMLTAENISTAESEAIKQTATAESEAIKQTATAESEAIVKMGEARASTSKKMGYIFVGGGALVLLIMGFIIFKKIKNSKKGKK